MAQLTQQYPQRSRRPRKLPVRCRDASCVLRIVHDSSMLWLTFATSAAATWWRRQMHQHTASCAMMGAHMLCMGLLRFYCHGRGCCTRPCTLWCAEQRRDILQRACPLCAHAKENTNTSCIPRGPCCAADRDAKSALHGATSTATATALQPAAKDAVATAVHAPSTAVLDRAAASAHAPAQPAARASGDLTRAPPQEAATEELQPSQGATAPSVPVEEARTRAVEPEQEQRDGGVAGKFKITFGAGAAAPTSATCARAAAPVTMSTGGARSVGALMCH